MRLGSQRVWFGLAAMAVCFATPAAEPAAGSPASVPVELWDRPRSGRSVIALPAVGAALASLASRTDARLVIRHRASAEGALQAEELRAWLIAHAIEPRRLELRSEAAAPQPLQLEIVP